MSSLDDTELRDGALLDEIHLVGELIIAASVSDGPLSDTEIDQVLGVEGVRDTAPGLVTEVAQPKRPEM